MGRLVRDLAPGVRSVEHLGWLVRHAQDVEHLAFFRDLAQAPPRLRDGVLAAGLTGGRIFLAGFAPEVVFRQWIAQRRSLRGVVVDYVLGVPPDDDAAPFERGVAGQ
jgi:hypothetical protein